HSGFETAHYQNEMKVVVDLLRFEGQRDKKLGFQTVGLALGKDADDRIMFVVQSNGLADDVAVAAKAFRPKFVRHDNHAVFSHNFFLGENIPPEHEGSANMVVEAWRGHGR